MAILETNHKIGKYTIQNLIKENLYTETYRVVDEDFNPFFLKLFAIKKMPSKLLDSETNEVLEISFCKKMKHRNIVSYIDSGSFETGSVGLCQYYLTNYFNGELLAEKLKREGSLSQETAVSIFKGIMEGLKYMHGQGIFHNDITPRNIILSSVDNAPEIIDLGHVSATCAGKVPFDTSDLELVYSANETFAGMYDEQSDIFAACAVLYAMLVGKAPWNPSFSDGMSHARRVMILKEYRTSNTLDFSKLPADAYIQSIVAKGLSLTCEDRYKAIDKILSDIETCAAPISPTQEHSQQATPRQTDLRRGDSFSQDSRANQGTDFEFKKGNGNGFQDIAGMVELKTYLQQRVIFIIKDKERVAKYKLTPPNGMLLYGPPGCGKTYIAEKFAEETGFNYILVKSSDLASSYIHGSQDKIARLFKQAEQNAPTVICFDEFDALVPDRSSPGAQYVGSEVNEFLSQLNNCSDRGLFVVGTTNRPDKIDPAVLRTGRMDKQVYVPLPDREARREMLILHMEGRPYDPESVDFEKLADMTDGYIASDIAYAVNDAAMVAAYTDREITEDILAASIQSIRPSLRPDTLKMYDEMQRYMESTERSNAARPRIGFKQHTNN